MLEEITVQFDTLQAKKHSMRFAPHDAEAAELSATIYIKNEIWEALGKPESIDVTVRRTEGI